MIDRDAGRVDHHVLIKGGVGESRVDLKNVDAEPPPFDANRFHESGDGELAGRVFGPARQSTAGIDRAHGDHHGVAAGGQEGQRLAADFDHGKNVDLEDATEHRGIVRIELPGRAHAGIVDDEIERAKAFAEIRCQFIILARKDELTLDYAPAWITLRKDELTLDYARKDELTPDYAADTGLR